MAIPLLISIAVVTLALNVLATIAIARDSLSTPVQRELQLLVAWLLPLLGSLIVLAVHRRAERPSRKYLERTGPEDEIKGIDVVGEAGAD